MDIAYYKCSNFSLKGTYSIFSTKMPAVFLSKCPRFLHIYCGPSPLLRSMEDGTINSDERGTTSKVSTECPLTMSAHSVHHWKCPHTVCPPLTKSTSEKVFNEQSLPCTLCPRAGHWKEQIRYFVQTMERRPTISSVLAIDTSSEELPRKFFREKGATHLYYRGLTIRSPVLNYSTQLL